ncbi:MAG: YbaN family protein [Bacteroidales bacterium]
MAGRVFFIVLGFFFVGLGIAGIFLPLIPTTGPLLLAAWFFTKGSPRWRTWLLHHPILGKYIHNYLKYRGTTRKVKIRAIATLWITLGVSGVLLYPRLWPLLILLGVGVGVTWHLLSLRTLSEEEIRQMQAETSPASEKQ